MTARDVLSWVAEQGVLTRDGVRQRERWRGPGVDGPWDAVVSDLVEAVDAGLADESSGVDRAGTLEGFDDYIEAHWLDRIVDRHGLVSQDARVVMGIAADLRMMFESTVWIGASGLDAPVVGDLSYLCTFDYEIDVPDWAQWRLD